jgi:hypothetical protein
MAEAVFLNSVQRTVESPLPTLENIPAEKKEKIVNLETGMKAMPESSSLKTTVTPYSMMLTSQLSGRRVH